MSDVSIEQSVVHDRPETKAPQFSVGLNVFMEMKTDKDISLRAQASIIGWQKNSVLITSAPTMNENVVDVSNGVNCVVRYIHKGSAFGFATNLLEKHQQHAHMWLLDFPKSVEMKPLRQAPRIKVLIPAENSENNNWNILNLSHGGALMCMAGELPAIGTSIEFSFPLPSGERIENLQAEIVRHQKDDEKKQVVGVKFLESQEDQLEKIQQYCDHYCKNHPKL